MLISLRVRRGTGRAIARETLLAVAVAMAGVALLFGAGVTTQCVR